MTLYTNFYENRKEAMMRLQNSVVLYDGEPYIVLTIASTYPDGIFRVYLDSLCATPNGPAMNMYSIPCDVPESEVGPMMDNYIDNNPKAGILRRMMNSPKFNKFRPFPLGMCNIQGSTFYMERAPQRNTQQGLTQNMLTQTPISLRPSSGSKATRPATVSVSCPEMRECIVGAYPTFQESIENLVNPAIQNEAVGFHRQFALVRGPVNVLYLAYRGDVIGYLPNGDGSCLILDNKFRYALEAITDLDIFTDIQLK